MNGLPDVGKLPIATPTNADFQAAAKKQEREMGGTFDKVFSPEAYGEGVRRMHRKRNQLAALMQRLNPRPWTVINLMPFPLNVNGVLHSRLVGKDGNQVPACAVGVKYVPFVIKEVQYSMKDEGAGMDNLDNYTPEPWDPSILAQDYMNEFVTRMGCGGVAVYEGDQLPEQCGQMPAVEKARKDRNQWLLRKVQEAEADWSDSSGRGRKNITELHRLAAEILLHEKILKHQPAWLLATNPAGDAPNPCPGCGEVSEKNAAICTNCRYIYDPLQAYKSTLIEYGHMSMERLTDEQWEEVSQIYAEREEQKRKREKGQIGKTSEAHGDVADSRQHHADQPGSAEPPATESASQDGKAAKAANHGGNEQGKSKSQN